MIPGNAETPNNVTLLAEVGSAFSTPVRVKMLLHLSQQPSDLRSLARAVGASVSEVKFHLTELLALDCGIVKPVEEGRPAGDEFGPLFQANLDSVVDQIDWQVIPGSIKMGMKSLALGVLANMAAGAVNRGLLGDPFPATVILRPLSVDETGWSDVATVLTQAREGVADAMKASEGRGDEEAVGTNLLVGLMAFEAPPVELGEI